MFCARQGVMPGTGDPQREVLVCPKSADISRTDRGRIPLQVFPHRPARHLSARWQLRVGIALMVRLALAHELLKDGAGDRARTRKSNLEKWILIANKGLMCSKRSSLQRWLLGTIS
jgi:hypothetical protein